MLRFFRSIRKRLLSVNELKNTGPMKYLIYGVGEILLVMIGILLALYVNNWNETRKQNRKEIVVLNNIKGDLIKSQKELQSASSNVNERNRKMEMVLDHISQKKDYHPKIDTALGQFIYFPSPFMTYTSYESLKASGTDLISNDSILNLLTDLYEYEFSYIIKDIDRLGWITASEIHLPFYVKNIEANVDGFAGKPNDYESLRNDQEFINILKLTLRHRKIMKKQFDITSDKIDILIKLIEKEADAT